MSYINEKDSVLDRDNIIQPISFADIILMAENDRAFYEGSDEQRKRIIWKLFTSLLVERRAEANLLIRKYMNDIIDAARPEDELNQTSSGYEDVGERIAIEICKLVKKFDMVPDFTIFANGKKFFFKDYNTNEITITTDDADPYKCSNYVRKPNILFMTFDSDIYEAFNYDSNENFVREFDKLVYTMSNHKLYYDFGEAYNLSLYTV